MTTSVLVIVSGLVLVVMGYRLDTDNGRLEQGALVQAETIPAGAMVKIDGKIVNTKTPDKSTVLAGIHVFEMQKDGYETWQKTLDIKAGTLTWLDYARLVPKDIKPEAVASYPSVYGSLVAPNGKTMIIQQAASTPTFEVVDLRTDDIKNKSITIPANAYSDVSAAGIAHVFTIVRWDSGGRYVLLKHNYEGKTEWLVLDTRDVTKTKNITSLFNADISSIAFSGASGNIFYALSGGDIRKLDLSSGIISQPLLTGVINFELFGTSTITYVGTDLLDSSKRIVGLYSDGDESPHVLRSTMSDPTVPLNIATSHYFNQDYIAISEGDKIDIVSGSYPPSGSEDSSSLSNFASLSLSANVDAVSFSPKGDYLLARSGADFKSYDIEHQRETGYTLPHADITIKWLDDDHTWSDYDGKLIMREFDGANQSVISPLTAGQSVSLTDNDRYIYSITTADSGYQLQRVRMVLP
jgi:hypothetical protein